MTRSRLTPLAVALLGVCFMTVGCCEKEQREIAALYAEKNQLLEQNQQLQEQIAQAAEREAELHGQVDTRDNQIAHMDATVQKLRAQAAAPPPPAPSPQPQIPPPAPPALTAKGWEQGTFADKITVGSDILFAPGRATLTKAGRRALGTITRDLKRFYAEMPVRVYGYTDSDPIKKTKKLWKDNLDLSANRAMAVTRYLLANGIEAQNVETIAMGATNPVSSNAAPSGKAKNRRVEIMVLKAASK